MNNRYAKQESGTTGFSTIEILIAFAVGIIFLSAAIMVAFSDPTRTRHVALGSGETVALDVMLDNYGLIRSTNTIGEILAGLTADWSMTILSDSEVVNPVLTYTQTPEVVDISSCMKDIITATQWRSQSDRARHITFGTGLSNMSSASALGRGVCDPTPPGDWDNPENPHWETHPNAIDGTQSGLAVAVVDGRTFAFITTTHTIQKDDLWVIDVSDVENPIVVDSLETGGDSMHAGGLNDIVVVTTDTGTYAYVLQNSIDNQLQTIEVSNPSSLLPPLSTVSFASYGVSSIGSNPQGRVITYYAGKLYVGLYTTIGPEFLVFDIEEDPTTPRFVGAIAQSFDHSINDIVIRGSYAYLAIKPANPPSGSNTKELMILDVSQATPVNTGNGFNANNGSTDTEAATTLYLVGNTLYLGRARVSNASEKDFYVFDVSSPLSPVVRKSKRLGISTGGGFGTPRIIDLVVQGRLGFFATTDSARPFQVYDVVSNLSDIEIVDTRCPHYVTVPKLVEIVYKDTLIYGANGNEAALNILRDQPYACTP